MSLVNSGTPKSPFFFFFFPSVADTFHRNFKRQRSLMHLADVSDLEDYLELPY